MATVFALFNPPFKTCLGLNNRLHILLRIQIYVFFHSTQFKGSQSFCHWKTIRFVQLSGTADYAWGRLH